MTATREGGPPLLSEHALSRALGRAGLRAPVRFEEVTPSTQAVALALAADGAPEWTLVAAGHQTEGRGRSGRAWVDEPGRSLLFSLVLRPVVRPDEAGLLTLLAGLSLAEACEEVADQRVMCKWPNDILVAGHKAAGILAESVLAGDAFAYVVLGLGVNLGDPPDALADVAAVDADAETVLTAFLRVFADGYQPQHPAFAAQVRSRYRERCATIGERVHAITTDGARVDGVAIDIDETGGLVVRTPVGERVVRFGEVEHAVRPRTEPG
jgi:BirA family biotin operon repressor/biotin-[acetyl-CoA-carboxylase] ligase